MTTHRKSYLIFSLVSLSVSHRAQNVQQAVFTPHDRTSMQHDGDTRDALSIPGNSPFKHCTAKITNDVLDVNWVTLIPNELHIAKPIQLMVNGTLSKNLTEDAKIRVHLAQKGSKYDPLDLNYKFCNPFDEVMQEDGPRCPPSKGGVEITGHAFVWFVGEGNVIETTIEALDGKNETIACLYGELEVVRG